MSHILVPPERLAEFCRKHHIVKLSFFGSVLRDDFGPQSDVDVLVEFDPAHVPGLIRLAGMEFDLAQLIGGRKIEMFTAQDLSRYFRNTVLADAQVQYVQPR